MEGGAPGQLAADFHAAAPWGEFGPAAFARAESASFSGGGVAEELAVFAHGRFDSAYGPAVNAGGFDGDKEAPVETRVTRHDRLIALI